MSKAALYESLIVKCERNAVHGGHPDMSALWRSIADQYRFLLSVEREHPTPSYDEAYRSARGAEAGDGISAMEALAGTAGGA